jgi:4-aminobutyrate aminotransferase/(S)-3-amino-2-methylpropionate transaminase
MPTSYNCIPRGLAITHPVFVARADGARIWDVEGKEYLDFASGIGVLNVGHRHPAVVEAIQDQLGRLMHTCFQVTMYEPYVRLASRLCRLVGGGNGRTHKTLLLTTGAEATENAVKIARAFTKRTAVIAFDGAFHGRSFLALAMTASSAAYRQNFGPFAPGVYHAPFPDEYCGWTTERALEALDQLFATEAPPEHIAAVIIEPQLGEGGFIPAPPEFLRRLRAITERHGIVFIADEVQTGFGRTGKMFGYQHAGIEPDLVAVAKSLGGGLPLSAVVGKAEIMDAPLPGGLGGTYAGNPLACAAALAVLDVFERENLAARGESIGRSLGDGLRTLQQRDPSIGDVRGLGAMLAMEFVRDRGTKEPDAARAAAVLDRSRAGGLLLLKCGPHKNVVRLLPPLIATDADVRRGLEILEGALEVAAT